MTMLTTLTTMLRSVFGPPAPAPAPKPVPRILNVVHDAASTGGRRSKAWTAPTTGANDGVLGDLPTLRNRSRAATRNDGYAKAAIDRLCTNIVGSGIVPQSQAPDPAVRAAINALFLRWTDFADASGTLDFYGFQALAVRSMLESGEVFVRLRARLPTDNLPVPLQLESLEADFVPVNYSTEFASGERVRAGIEFSPIGERTAYFMYRQRPGAWADLDTSQLSRVSAVDATGVQRVAHLFEPSRPGAIRGIPHLTAALVRLHDLDAYDDAVLVRQQIANLFVGFVTRSPGDGDAADPLTGQPFERDANGQPMIPLEPGVFQELSPGEDVKFSEPPDATSYGEFMRAQLQGAAVAAEVPYSILTGDFSQMNDRTARVLLQEFRRRVDMRQQHIVAYQLCRPVWAAWFRAAVQSGALTMPAAYWTNPEPWERVEWTAPAFPYISPTADVEAERAMVRAGFKSRTAVMRERGYDPEQLDNEIAADNARADRLGLKFDSDGRQKAAGGSPTVPSPSGRTRVIVDKEVVRDPKTKLISHIRETRDHAED